jgi:glycosyltransferase involved in cell wall biosynthesis
MTVVPKVTVLMPVYNAARFVREAMDSILGQTFTDYEFLILDDGSTDESVEIIGSYPDERIRLVRNERNLRLAATLNRGLALARGEYVARMDADDISLPERLAKQVAFLDAHPDIGICGTWAQAFGEAHFQIIHPADNERIRAKLLFDSALVHPAVLLRREALARHQLIYREFYPIDDYDLWQRASRLFPLANIPERLLCYRVTEQSAFHSAVPEAQAALYRRLDEVSLSFLGLHPTLAELDLHAFLRCPLGSRAEEAEAWLRKLRDANAQTGYYDAAAFQDVLRERWFLVCYLLPGGGLGRWRRYVRSPLYEAADFTPPARLKVLAKFLVQRLRSRLGR